MLLKLMEEEERESPREAMMNAERISPQLHVTETDGRRKGEREHQRSHDEPKI